MTGFPGFNQAEFLDGWYEVNTEGLATLYLTITDEGIVTLTSDTPSAKVFESRIRNPESISIKRRPIVWPHGDTSVQMAAIGSIELDSVDGLYTYLVGADLRDAQIVIKLAPAQAFGSATMIADSPTMITAIFENATSNEDTVTISLRDILSTLDRPLPVRINPPFVDAGAANRMVPISLGACRNVTPLTIDGANRISQIADAPISNLAAARDGGANLDRNATPPQFVPALSGSGIQLQTDTVDKFTVDCSSVGQQGIVPGVPDVLDGAGEFDSWSGSPSTPDGWLWSNNTGSRIQRLGTPQYPIDDLAYIQSSRPWYPRNNLFGDWLVTEAVDSNGILAPDLVLKSGKAYRLYAHIFSTFSAAPFFQGGLFGGIMFRSALSDLAADAISPHGQALTVPLLGRYSYAFDFRCPVGSDRPIYAIAVAAEGGPGAGQAIGVGGGIIYDLKLEELGEYVELPLQGIGIKQFFIEWLVNRAGLDDSAFNEDDLEDLDDATGYEIGYHVTEQPNILDGLRTVADNWGATLFADHTGQIRVKRLTDPKDGTPIADFDATNIIRPIQIVADDAENLTTVIGTARNWDPFTDDSQFVTDRDSVPREVMTRFSQTSQYLRTSSKSPAGQYSFAIGAPAFHSLLDDPSDGQTEIDRVVGIFSPRIYDDGTVSTGKRKIATITVRYDEYDRVGVTQFCDVRDLIYGGVISITYPSLGFERTPVEIIGWELFPFANQIILTVFY